MAKFHEKLALFIGDTSVNEWARIHELPPQTVHGWIKDERIPRGANLRMLAEATGRTAEWWLSDQDDPTEGEHNTEYKPRDRASEPPKPEARQLPVDLYIDNYVEVRAAAGHGQLTPTDQLVLQLKVNAADWRRYVGLDHKHVKIITVHGDSMKPTLSHGDQVMVDTACSNFIDDTIYCIQQGDNLRFKRIKLQLDGKVIVKSDNEIEGFPPEIYTAEEAANFHVIGRVIPLKFGWFEI